MVQTIVVIAVIVAGYFLYRKFSKGPTVDSIVSDITAKVESLHAVKEAQHDIAVGHDFAAAKYNALAEEARKERDKAASVAEKLTALVS